MKRRWPEWWTWELELSSHLMKRMVDRRFTELDLRRMIDHCRRLRRDIVPGRWVAVTSHRRQRWEVIAEPDFERELLIVITAYPVG